MATERKKSKWTGKRIKSLPAAGKEPHGRREKDVKGGTNPSNDKRFRIGESLRDGSSNTL